MTTISIYKGAGASPTNARLLHQVFSEALHSFGAKIRFINEEHLNDPTQKWRDQTDVLVIGGGAYGEMKQAVPESSRKGIHDFALEKKTVGICMGGYGLSAATIFQGENISKTSDGMNVFNGHAIGALPITPVLYNGNSNSARIVTLRHNELDISFPALYWGGPSFHFTDHTDPRITATTTLKVDYAAEPLTMGVKIQHKEGGTTLLVGYHSEATKPSYLSGWVGKFKSCENDFMRFENEIAQNMSGKYYVGFAALLDDIGIVPGHSFVNQIINRPEPRHITVPMRGIDEITSAPALQF
jgi:glutamine amidotransferase-like uncharacterized protein